MKCKRCGSVLQNYESNRDEVPTLEYKICGTNEGLYHHRACMVDNCYYRTTHKDRILENDFYISICPEIRNANSKTLLPVKFKYKILDGKSIASSKHCLSSAVN